MKDSDARARILALEADMRTLPFRLAQAIHGDLKPMLDTFNDAISTFNAATVALEALEKRVTDHGELMEVLESDVNAVRVDVNAVRESVAGISAAVTDVEATTRSIASGLSQIGKAVPQR